MVPRTSVWLPGMTPAHKHCATGWRNRLAQSPCHNSLPLPPATVRAVQHCGGEPKNSVRPQIPSRHVRQSPSFLPSAPVAAAASFHAPRRTECKMISRGSSSSFLLSYYTYCRVRITMRRAPIFLPPPFASYETEGDITSLYYMRKTFVTFFFGKFNISLKAVLKLCKKKGAFFPFTSRRVAILN